MAPAPEDDETIVWNQLGPDDLPDGLVVADESGKVIGFNAAAGRITGIDACDALGRDIADALPLQDMQGRWWWRCTDPYGGLVIRTGQPEVRLLLPNGRDVLVTARYVRERLGQRRVRRLVVSLRDTSMRTRAERNHAELIATVAHELRSPLTSVKGFTATLLAKWSRFTDEQKQLMLETVDADADRVTRLIAELLDIARIDSGRLRLQRQPVDVGELVTTHVAALRTAGASPGRFVVTLAGPVPPAYADADKLRQVLANLLENALRHGAGTVTVSVSAEGQGAGERVIVTVDDEGPGIPDELVGRVFTRFWRGNRRGGTGLGLYIVKGLIEAHGGDITIGRAPTGGARFRVTVPAAPRVD
jgi:PAS domain S-box-containing protein